MMTSKKIAVIKVRSSQDVELVIPRAIELGLPMVGAGSMVKHMKAAQGQVFLPNLALPYLAALGMAHDKTTGKHHEYVLIDEKEEDLHKWAWDIDLAMFTVSTTNCMATYRVADFARSRGIKVVLGGIHPSTLPDEAMPHADAVAVGEAETIIARIIDDFDAGHLSGIYDGGKATSLAGLPVPAWELGVTRIVDDCNGPAGSTRNYAPWVIPVQTSRGCRNACYFCSTTRFQGANRRHRPVGEIVTEIQALQNAGVLTNSHTVFFTDNNIVSDSDHSRKTRDTAYARSLFAALEPLGITWVGQGEITVGEDVEMVDQMSKSGCHMLLIGMETISQKGLGGLGKGAMNVDKYAACLKTLHDHGISNIGCFIMGIDGQGLEAFEATKKFIQKHVDVPQISVMTPYPGTALHHKMVREGRIISQDWSMYDITHVVFKPDTMTAHQLEVRYAAMLNDVYSWNSIFARARRHGMRRTVNGMPAFNKVARFTSIFAPNIVYRTLSLNGRGLPADAYAGVGSVLENIFPLPSRSMYAKTAWAGGTAVL
jgi:radical SAM superfamily enzyme YgiQ (UPF0313 family)